MTPPAALAESTPSFTHHGNPIPSLWLPAPVFQLELILLLTSSILYALHSSFLIFCFLHRSSGAALSPLVCISALNFGGLLPIAVAFGLPIGPLVLPNPATAEHYSPVWWLFALLALPACFFGFFDLQSRPAFDFLARSLEFYQVLKERGTSNRYQT